MKQTRLKFLEVGMGILLALSAQGLWAAPVITSVNRSADQVVRYGEQELTVGLTGTFNNPYDPDEIDLWGEFSSPSHKSWRINGFYDGAQWKIRFAPNESGVWSYVVKAKDVSGTGEGAPAEFGCIASTNHGWVKIAPNHRYLSYDDGTSFYGVGACYPWGNTSNGLEQMHNLGFNVYVYWNGTYDTDGGNNLIESTASGVGQYDQGKCRRIDELINESDERGLGMILVIWPHDYLSENMHGWPSGWSKNPYNTITTSEAFYGDDKAWSHEEKMYRYMIARWGYSEALTSWQTVDEISGTNGWKNRPAANAWAAKIAGFFQTNDPFRHPTNASHGNFWDEGNQADDLSNTEIYGNYSTANITATIHKLWNGYEKPCIMGETGVDRNAEVAHRKLWAGLASGISITPLLWSFNQGWSSAVSTQYAPFEKFIAGLDFAHLTSLAQAKVDVPGSSVFGISSDQLTFGWVTDNISGKSLDVTGLGNGTYNIEWWDCAAGTVLSTSTASVTDGSMSVVIPTTNQADLAFKIVRQRSTVSSG